MILKPGDIIDGRYVVEALLGQGGLAEVYKVRHQELQSVHALKLLLWRHKNLVERMLLEGRIQAQLRHPHIVAVTDVIRHDGWVSLLLEYVDGYTLAYYIEQRGGLPLDDALSVMAPVLAAMTAAHDAGVLHRDLKPANILLASNPSGLIPKVMDFGIAKVVLENKGHGITTSGMMMGSPGYLAPEQFADPSTVDQRADIYALGLVLYEALAGKRAYPEAIDIPSAQVAIQTPPPALQDIRPDLPPAITTAIDKAIATERGDRFADCRALANAIFAQHPHLLSMVERPQVNVAFHLQLVSKTPANATAKPSTTVPPPHLTQSEDVGNPTFLPEANAAEPTPQAVVPRSRFPVKRWVMAVALLMTMMGVGVVFLAATMWVFAEPSGSESAATTATETRTEPAVEEPSPSVEEPSPSVVDAPPATEDPEALSPVEAAVETAESPSEVVATTPTPSEETAAEPVEGVAEVTVATEDALPGEENAQPPTTSTPEAASEGDAVAMVEPPEEQIPVEQPTVSAAEAVLGSWTGTANNLRFQLDVVAGGGEDLAVTMTFVQGSNQRKVSAVGQFDAATNVLVLYSSAERLRFEGVVDGNQINGSFQRGGRGRNLTWSVSR